MIQFFKSNFLTFLVLIMGAVVPSTLFSGVVFIIEKLGYPFPIGLNFLFSTLLMWLGAIFAYNHLIYRVKYQKNLNFNLQFPKISIFILSLMMIIGMMFLNSLLSDLIPTTGAFWGKLYHLFEFLMKQLMKTPVIMVILVLIVAPIFEEIVFRGIIQKELIQSGISPIKSIIITAFLFGLVHFNPWQFLAGLLLGFILGYAYYRTQKIILPILLHFFNNLCSVLLIYLQKDEYFKFFSKENLENFDWIFLVLGILLLFPSFYFFYRKTNFLR